MLIHIIACFEMRDRAAAITNAIYGKCYTNKISSTVWDFKILADCDQPKQVVKSNRVYLDDGLQ